MQRNIETRTAKVSRRAFMGSTAAVAASFSSLAQTAMAEPRSMDKSQNEPAGPVDEEMKKRLLPYFADLCDWIMTLQVGSGRLQNTKDTPWSVFINGNLARALLSGHEITGKASYLRECLRWCDTFANQQQRVRTSRGEDAGFWADAGDVGNIYLADVGTASTALALGYKHADPRRQKRYLEAMQRYALFVRHGCDQDPQAQGRGGSPGWVIASGKDRGALGCGYYKGHLSTAPYVISSGVNGGAFHALLHSLTKDPRPAEIAAAAVRWMLAQIEVDGRIPYIIDNEPPRYDWSYCTMTYCGEGFIAAYMHIDDDELRKHIAAKIKPSIDWLIASQNPDGAWGKPGSFDIQRSPGVATLLAWYYRSVDQDERIALAVRKYCEFLLLPENSKTYGVKELVRTSGFVGLVVADLIQPGATFA